MPRRDFVALPSVPGSLDNPELIDFLASLKENVELLAALAGDRGNHAILRGDIETAYPGSINGTTLAALAASTQALADTVRALLAEMKP
jgi:hypothetical protein